MNHPSVKVLLAALPLVFMAQNAVADYLVGEASSMVTVRPQSDIEITPVEKFSVRLAKGERENFQILIKSDHDLEHVYIAFEGDEDFKYPVVKVSAMGYVNLVNKPEYFNTLASNPTLGWWPDPLIEFVHTLNVKAGDVQVLWVRVNCPREAKAGIHHLKLNLLADGEEPKPFPLEVRVNDFEMPVVSLLPLAITFSPGSHQVLPGHYSHPLQSELDAMKARNEDLEGPVMMWEHQRERWADFLADYFITADSLYLGEKERPYFDLLERLKGQNRLGRFNLGYWSYPKDDSPEAVAKWREHTIPRIRESYEKAKELGILDHAYVYGCDEINEDRFPLVRLAIDELHREFPGVPLLTTATDQSLGGSSPLDAIDYFCPRLDNYDPEAAAAARERGHQVWWYICCYPHSPYPNMFIESRPIEGRLLMGAMAAKFKPDGFLYYQISVWNSVRPMSGDTYTDWDPRSWSHFNNGDGAWTAVGPDGIPVPTQRLENFRDGLEDYAYFKMAESLGAEVPDDLVKSLTEYSDDPAKLRAWRDHLADLIEQNK